MSSTLKPLSLAIFTTKYQKNRLYFLSCTDLLPTAWGKREAGLCSAAKGDLSNFHFNSLQPEEISYRQPWSQWIQRTIRGLSSHTKDSEVSCKLQYKAAADLFFPFFSRKLLLVLRAISLWKWLFSTWTDLRACVFFRKKKKIKSTAQYANCKANSSFHSRRFLSRILQLIEIKISLTLHKATSQTEYTLQLSSVYKYIVQHTRPLPEEAQPCSTQNVWMLFNTTLHKKPCTK